MLTGWIQILLETYAATLQAQLQEAWLVYQHMRGRQGTLGLSTWYLSPDDFVDTTGVIFCGTQTELQPSLKSCMHPHFGTVSWMICLLLQRCPPSPKAVCRTSHTSLEGLGDGRCSAEMEGGKKGLKDRGTDGLQLADVQG